MNRELEKFFDKFFRDVHTLPLKDFKNFLTLAEAEFKRLGYREKISSAVENILIVRLDAIGDMILTSGFIREVRKNFPNARITLVCSSLVYPVVELCPYVNEVLPFDVNVLDKNFLVKIEQIADFCREHLWRRNFSIAFSPQWGDDKLPALLMCWLSGARERIGFGIEPAESWLGKPKSNVVAINNFLLTRNVVTPKDFVSEVEKHLYLLAAVGLTVSEIHNELFFGTADFIRARELLKNIPANCKKVLLGIGAGGLSRKYPVEKYLVALRELAKRNFVFIITGGKNELEDANFLEHNLPRGKILNLVGKTTLRETEAIISQTDFYIGNDSGVMHMAAAAKIPVLAIYREAADKEDYLPGVYSEYRRFPPWQTKSVILRPNRQLAECAKLRPIYGWCHGVEPHCITQIEPQEIVAAFEQLEALETDSGS